MGFVDGGTIQLRAQLGNGMIAVVHPDLDDVHLFGGIFIDVLARFGNGSDPIGSLRASGFWAGETASGGVVARGVGDGLGTHLVYLVAGILAEAHRGADAVVSEMLQLIHKSVTGHRQVLMGVDDRRHHRLSGQIHASGARGNLELTLSADGGEVAVLNDESRIFDGRASVSNNKPRPFEHRHGRRHLRLDDDGHQPNCPRKEDGHR